MAHPTCCVVRASMALPPGCPKFWPHGAGPLSFGTRPRNQLCRMPCRHARLLVWCPESAPTSPVLHRVGRSIRLEHLGVHDQAVAVLYQKIPVVAQLGFFTLAL